jgi:hypothetical protein
MFIGFSRNQHRLARMFDRMQFGRYQQYKNSGMLIF